jgi:hypothetical protein
LLWGVAFSLPSSLSSQKLKSIKTQIPHANYHIIRDYSYFSTDACSRAAGFKNLKFVLDFGR